MEQISLCLTFLLIQINILIITEVLEDHQCVVKVSDLRVKLHRSSKYCYCQFITHYINPINSCPFKILTGRYSVFHIK